MGLLSKLFGDNKDVEKAAKDLLGGIFSEATKGGAKEAAEPDRPSENSGWGFEIPSGSGEDRETESAASGPSGESWGPVMPAEPNQYNYNGPWSSYFEEIFRTEFSQYRMEKENLNGTKRLGYSFYEGDRKVLYVELMSRTSSSVKIRANCRKAGIPYLRFYYDYQGWWNTRAYVVKRMNNAIGWS